MAGQNPNQGSGVSPSGGGLCNTCSEFVYTCDIGHCSKCGHYTSSGAFKLCYDCSGQLGQCMHCGQPLTVAVPTP